MPEAVKEASEVNAQVNEEPEKVEKPDVASSGTLPEENVPMDAEAEKAPPTDAEKPEEGNTDEKPTAEAIQEIVNKGRELIAHHDYVAAADLFAKACEYSATLYGDMGEECAENYFLYGTAMLECGKAENTVLGEKVKDKDEDDEDEEVEDEEDKENQENGENGEKPAEEENDDSSLKAAWEVLELAKVIFEKKGDKVRLSDCYLKLGEVGVESGHPTAMDDMMKCLEIRKELYPGERILSETYFNIGLAYSTYQLFNEAVENFQLSKSVLESRMASLKTKDDKKSLDEIKEIEELLPELDEKILDMKESKKVLLEEIAKNGIAKVGEGSSSTEVKTEEKKASDISHLVKRKRKIDEVTEDLNEKKKMICKESDKTEPVTDKVESVEKMDTISKEESQPEEKNGKTETAA